MQKAQQARKVLCVCVCAFVCIFLHFCASYVVVVHEFSALTGQSASQKFSSFNGCRGQLRTPLKQKKIWT